MALVRHATEKDIPSIMELLKQVNKVHYDKRPDLFKLATKYSKEELSDILANESSPVFVYEDDNGHILGHGFCVMKRPDNTKLLNDILTLYIDDICVDERVRGKHVGKAIYDHIIDYARSKGCYNVTLNVWSCNLGAMKFYEKLGLTSYKIGMETIL